MEIRKINFNEVEEAYYNPRKQLKKTDKAYRDIKKSIETYGMVEPMVVNEVTMRLVSGHQRLQVLKDLGHTEAEFSIVHIEDQTQEKALNVSLNKIKGKFDNTKLYDVLRDIKDEVDITDLGFEMSEVESILGESDVDEALAEEDLDLTERVAVKPSTNVMLKIGKTLSYNYTTDDYKEVETSCIEQGFFSDLEISQELKRRLLYDKVN